MVHPDGVDEEVETVLSEAERAEGVGDRTVGMALHRREDGVGAAVAGSGIVYLTVGLPMNSELWEQQFPTMMANTIAACRRHGSRLVLFDNTYMYPRTSTPQTEETVFNRIRAGRRPLVPLDARTRRTLIWTPDASRAMARIGNTPDAYGQTWHPPVDPDRLTYPEMIDIASQIVGKRIPYTTVPGWAFRIGGLLDKDVNEAEELLPRYRQDNIFDSSKFARRFPDFMVTGYRRGITRILTGE